MTTELIEQPEVANEPESFAPKPEHIAWFHDHVCEAKSFEEIGNQCRMAADHVADVCTKVNRWFMLRYEKNREEEIAKKLFLLDSLVVKLHGKFLEDKDPKYAAQIRMLIHEWMEIQGGHVARQPHTVIPMGGNTTHIDKQITVLLQSGEPISDTMVVAAEAMDAARRELKIAESA